MTNPPENIESTTPTPPDENSEDAANTPKADKPVTLTNRTAARKPNTLATRPTPAPKPAPTRAEYWLAIMLFGIGMFGLGGVVGGVGGVMLFMRLTGGTADPSTPVSAPTLEFGTAEATAQVNAGTPTATPTPEVTASPTSALSPTPTSLALIAPASSGAGPAGTTYKGVQLFRITQENSEARFTVEETSPPTTAIGRTNQIAGDMLVDFTTPANSRLGVIRINLRTLQSDSPERDQSIRCCILLSAYDGYEFTDFVPKQITGLPAQVVIGQPVTFQVAGDLTLRDITKTITFDVTVTISNTDLRGTAQATVKRSDYNLIYDEHLIEHGVAENITLAFDFVAAPVAQ